MGEASYVGSDSHKLTSLLDSNPFLLGTTRMLFDTQPGVPAGNFSFLDTFVNVANANYNSLQASLQKRISDLRFIGTTYFTLAYTFYDPNTDITAGTFGRVTQTWDPRIIQLAVRIRF